MDIIIISVWRDEHAILCTLLPLVIYKCVLNSLGKINILLKACLEREDHHDPGIMTAASHWCLTVDSMEENGTSKKWAHLSIFIQIENI